MTRTLTIAIALIASQFAASARADVTLPSVIGSNMVLQRDQAIKLWGWAEPGEKIAVKIGGASESAQADKAGRWRVSLPAMKAGGPHVVTITGNNTHQLENVMVGEVWLCSGQSNMDFSVNGATDSKNELAQANFPNIRLFSVARVTAGVPQENVQGEWQPCGSATAKNFSAVAYFFGRRLHQDLNVPIGLIRSAWGGTRIEPWTPIEGYDAIDQFKEQADKLRTYEANWRKASLESVAKTRDWLAQAELAQKRGRTLPPPQRFWPNSNPGNYCHIYNGMIAPLAPFGIRGVIWYQGEANVGQGKAYTDYMRALIGGWRQVWDQKDNANFPFLFVQLAPYTYGGKPTALPEIWNAQRKSLSIPNTGMAVTTDIGEAKNIHPRNKQDVGKRLALWALANTYAKKDIVYSGPLYKGMKIDGKKVHIQFDHIGGGLESSDLKPLTWFEIAGKDNKFVHAKAEIGHLGETLTVWSDVVDEPRAVRFGWHQTATPNLQNAQGLPASPFHSGE